MDYAPPQKKQCTREYLQNDINSVSIHMLNDDCLRYIFLFLPIIERVRVEIVCKRWRILILDTWRMMNTLDLSYPTFYKTWDYLTENKTVSACYILLRKIYLNCVLLCPNLKSINIAALKVYGADIQRLANKYTNVTKFHLGATMDNCEFELSDFFNMNRNLQHVTISENSEILGESLSWLPVQKLHTLVLKDCHIKDEHLSIALKKLENLKHLVIIDCINIRKYTYETIRKHCKNLSTLEFTDDCSLLQEEDLLHLAQLVSLQILKITDNFELSDAFLTSLAQHCQQLTYIDISGCSNVTDTGLTALAKLPKLEVLRIDNLDHVTDSSLQNICGLKRLHCEKCVISDQSMSMLIKSSPELEYMNISGCKNITNITLNAAKDACNSRSNDINLLMIIGGASILHELKEGEMEQTTPLLKIVNIDFSSRY